MDVGGSERFQSHMTVRLESCMEPTRVGEGAGVRVVGLRWAGGGWGWGGGGRSDESHSVKEKRLKRRLSISPFDSVVPILGVASHSEMSHLDDKKVFVWLFLKKKKENRKSAHTHLLY